MKTATFNPNAITPAEHLSNCQFQLNNVEGWIGMNQMDIALMKAKFLLESAQKLVESLEELNRKK